MGFPDWPPSVEADVGPGPSLELIRIQQSRSVMYCDKTNLLLPNPKHHPIAAHNDFTDCWIAGLRYDSARIWKCCDSIERTKDVCYKKTGVLKRVFGDESNDRLQVLRGLGGPFYFNHFLIFNFIFS